MKNIWLKIMITICVNLDFCFIIRKKFRHKKNNNLKYVKCLKIMIPLIFLNKNITKIYSVILIRLTKDSHY